MDKLSSPSQEISVVLNSDAKRALTLSDIVTLGKTNWQTVYNNLRILLDLGSITEKKEEGFPPRRLISLTQKEKTAAELLEQVEKVLNN